MTGIVIERDRAQIPNTVRDVGVGPGWGQTSGTYLPVPDLRSPTPPPATGGLFYPYVTRLCRNFKGLGVLLLPPPCSARVDQLSGPVGADIRPGHTPFPDHAGPYISALQPWIDLCEALVHVYYKRTPFLVLHRLSNECVELGLR